MTDHLTDREVLERIRAVRSWYHQITIRPGIVTPGTNHSAASLGRLDFPSDCSGLTVLDIGTRDGFFAFELERRGADVVALDYVPAEATGFKVAAELLNSRVRYVQDNVYDISPAKYGAFDIVLFLGILYHLPDPLGALQIVRSVCRSTLYLETYVIDGGLLLPSGESCALSSISPALEEIPLMQFFPNDNLNRDFSNFWGPNAHCVEAMLEATEFQVLNKRVHGDRAFFRCQVSAPATKLYHLRVARGLEHRTT